MATINRFRGTPRATLVDGIRWIASASNVAPDPDTDVGPTATIAPPAGLQVGDLVVVYCYYRGATQNWSVSTTGGQQWQGCATHRSTTQMVQAFFCRFNGTWAANPVFTVGAGTETAIAVMHAFRGAGADSRWALDQSPLLNSAAGSAFAVAGITPQSPRTLAIACVASLDDNEYTITAPGRWALLGNKQYRSTGGTDAAMVFAQLPQTTADATGAVTFTQSTLGADAGITLVLAFKEGEDLGQGRAQISRAPSRRAPGRQMFVGQRLALDAPAATGDATAPGDTLACTTSLLAGTANGGAVADGQTLTATASLIPGAASAGGGSATASGVTLTATSSLIAGTANGGALASAATLTATSSLIAGTANGGALAAAATLTATSSLVAGTASGGAVAAAATLTATSSLIAGTANGGAVAAGVTLTATSSLIAGAASGGGGSATAAGVTQTVQALLVAGAAAGSALAAGQTLTAVASLLAGAASGGGLGDAAAPGVTLDLVASLLAGIAQELPDAAASRARIGNSPVTVDLARIGDQAVIDAPRIGSGSNSTPAAAVGERALGAPDRRVGLPTARSPRPRIG
jgi:hypothetical protein